MLLPFRAPVDRGSDRPRVGAAARSSLAIYAGGVLPRVLLFMTRTWHYTGVFSLFYGTSLRHNDTGLRPWTLFDGEVWAKVGHSLASICVDERTAAAGSARGRDGGRLPDRRGGVAAGAGRRAACRRRSC